MVTTDTATEVAPPAGTPAEHAAGRRTGKGRRRPVVSGRRMVVAICAILVAAALGYLLSWNSPVPIRDVQVVGAQPATQREILLAAGIDIGTPIRDVDTEAIVATVDAMPGIDGASVELSRPWTIVLDVVERFPFALVQNGDQWTVVDATGQAIRDVAAKPEGLPELAAGPDRWPGALAALAGLPDDIRGRIKSVTVADDGQIIMTLRSGATVQWGSSERSADKARALAALLPYDAKTYNLATPDRPAISGDLKLPKANQVPPEEPQY